MQYTSDVSDANNAGNVSAALKNVFKYSNAIFGGDGTDNIGAGLTTMLNPNLDAGLPCLLGLFGSDESASNGHAIIADGYGYDSSTLYHHLNMGWSGVDSAWYNLPKIVAGKHDFTIVADCGYNIYTSGSGEIVSGRVLDVTGNPVSGATVQAVRSGGGTWTVTTNANGIYAFSGVPSASTYTLSATVPGQTYTNLTAVTGTSANKNTTSGDVWGNDFTVPPTLSVQSTPPIGLSIGSSTGYGGTTNYVVQSIALGTSVNLAAPAADPAGYTFSQWTLDGTAQAASQKSITFTMKASRTAVAVYTLDTYKLTVQSTPPTRISIGSSSGDGGMTNYTVPGVAYGASVNLEAPAADPAGYTFSQWTVDGAAQTPGQKSITLAMDSAVTAVAHYTGNVGYTLTVHSTSPTGQVITSSTSDGGLTNYTVPDVPSGASVNVQAPATDPAGYTFSQWTVDGAAQSPGQKSITFPMDAAVTAVAHYTSNIGYALTVQSTPPTGLSIGSGTGQGRTTNYTVTGIEAGATVNLVAPATDPPGYTFSQWAINGAAQPAGQSISFVMDEDVTAVAQYTRNGYALTVESTPVTGLSIGSSTGRKGTTNYYTNTNVAAGTSVNLEAPATDPKGYTFTGWTVNGVSQTLGQKSITFTMTEAVTAVAWYTLNGYSLTVQSTPPTGLSIGSSTGQTGVTNYTKTGVGFGLSVNVQAPATDPAGYTFSQWTLNGAAQTDGEKSITFTMDAAITAVAHYTQNVVYTLTVQSTPPTGIIIASSSADGRKTNYSVPGVAYGASVNLVAPATDPAGYTFSYWTVDGEAQTPGQKSIMLTMDSAVTAVAHYTANAGYTLTVQSTPPTGQVITSSTSDGGRTPYPVPGVTYGTSVNLQAPATDPAGYVFSQWKVNGAAQTPGQKSITFTMTAATTAVAVYLKNAP